MHKVAALITPFGAAEPVQITSPACLGSYFKLPPYRK